MGGKREFYTVLYSFENLSLDDEGTENYHSTLISFTRFQEQRVMLSTYLYSNRSN
jgi:hypothetical protein